MYISTLLYDLKSLVLRSILGFILVGKWTVLTLALNPTLTLTLTIGINIKKTDTEAKVLDYLSKIRDFVLPARYNEKLFEKKWLTTLEMMSKLCKKRQPEDDEPPDSGNSIDGDSEEDG